MTIDITFSKTAKKKADAVVICFYKDKEPTKAVTTVKKSLGAAVVNRALEISKGFNGKHGQVEITLLPDGSPYNYLIFLGFGDKDKLDTVAAEKAGGKLYAAMSAAKIQSAELYANDDIEEVQHEIEARLVAGALLRSYSFEIYKSKKDDDEDPEIKPESLNVVSLLKDEAEAAYQTQKAIVDGVFMARDLVNEPPNVLFPYAYADRIIRELRPLGVDVEVFDQKKLEKLGLGAMLAVGQGSAKPPCMVIMHWKGSGNIYKSPLALVGKGVTFDTGGISLKPGAGMGDMKMDMGGSAAVVGTMKALALRKAKTNVIGVVGLVENMPSDRAYRPADIVKSYSGKMVEVLNTDAEGRLVLADALSYVQKNYKPRAIVNLATLTGAMIVALGHEYCGTFSNNDELWEQIDEAGKQTDDKVWRMPLDEVFKKEMESDTADLQNLAKCGRDAGSCTAAGFLWAFIEDDIPWAHMDIAGTAWIKKDRDISPKYGTGFGVRLLDRMISNHYE